MEPAIKLHARWFCLLKPLSNSYAIIITSPPRANNLYFQPLIWLPVKTVCFTKVARALRMSLKRSANRTRCIFNKLRLAGRGRFGSLSGKYVRF